MVITSSTMAMVAPLSEASAANAWRTSRARAFQASAARAGPSSVRRSPPPFNGRPVIFATRRAISCAWWKPRSRGRDRERGRGTMARGSAGHGLAAALARASADGSASARRPPYLSDWIRRSTGNEWSHAASVAAYGGARLRHAPRARLPGEGRAAMGPASRTAGRAQTPAAQSCASPERAAHEAQAGGEARRCHETVRGSGLAPVNATPGGDLSNIIVAEFDNESTLWRHSLDFASSRDLRTRSMRGSRIHACADPIHLRHRPIA